MKFIEKKENSITLLQFGDWVLFETDSLGVIVDMGRRTTGIAFVSDYGYYSRDFEFDNLEQLKEYLDSTHPNHRIIKSDNIEIREI